MAKDSGFNAAFADARKRLGAGKTFTYNGKSYSTNRADDKPAKAAAPTASQRPQPRPASATPAPVRQAAGTPTAGYNPKPKPAMPMNPNLRTEAGRQAMVGKSTRPTSPAPKPAPAPAPRAGGILSRIGDFFEGGGLAGKKARDAAAAAAAKKAKPRSQAFSKGGKVK